MYREERVIHYPLGTVKQKECFLDDFFKQFDLVDYSYRIKLKGLEYECLEIVRIWDSETSYKKADKRLSLDLISLMVMQSVHHG